MRHLKKRRIGTCCRCPKSECRDHAASHPRTALCTFKVDKVVLGTKKKTASVRRLRVAVGFYVISNAVPNAVPPLPVVRPAVVELHAAAAIRLRPVPLARVVPLVLAVSPALLDHLNNIDGQRDTKLLNDE